MKKIECVIRQEKLKEVGEALRLAGVGGMTVGEVKGFGKETTRPDAYLVLPKTKIEIYATDNQVDELISIIVNTCRTGKLGDGKIAVLPLEDTVRIRTGERKGKAIF